MAIISYRIASGLAPFTARLTPSSIPENVHMETGTFLFVDVPNGIYTLQVEDANGCIFERELTVDPFATTTTTTIVEEDSLVVGNAQDPILIFNKGATNRSSEYIGFPDPDVVTLYLWVKTLNGEPLITQKQFNYEISSDIPEDQAIFNIVDYSDQINSQISETASGPAPNIEGEIVLLPGFIEGFFEYTYERDINNRFTIDLTSSIDVFDPNLTLTGGTNIYGVTTSEKQRIVMQF
jgi:hypothetical protein